MPARQLPIASYSSPHRSLERCRSLEDSPEAILLSLGAEIHHLSGERPFSVELVLREQVFVLLLEGFRLQQLPGGLKGLVPPQPGPLPHPGQERLPVGQATRTTGRGFGLAGQGSWLAGQAALLPPDAALDQPVVALLQAGMGWVQVDGQAAALCFPALPQQLLRSAAESQC